MISNRLVPCVYANAFAMLFDCLRAAIRSTATHINRQFALKTIPHRHKKRVRLICTVRRDQQIVQPPQWRFYRQPKTKFIASGEKKK